MSSQQLLQEKVNILKLAFFDKNITVRIRWGHQIFRLVVIRLLLLLQALY